MRIIVLLMLVMLGCTSSRRLDKKAPIEQTKRATLINQEKDIYIEKKCRDKAKAYVIDNYNFNPNFHRTFCNNIFSRVIYFRINQEMNESENPIIDDRFVYVILNDTCGVDSVITSLGKIDK